MFDVEKIRRDFPILQRQINGKPLVWLDSAATAQKPQAVIDRVSRYYVQENSNIHRGTHTLAEVACDAYEDARDSVAVFMNAGWQDEIVFVRGTTEGINLLAATFADTLPKPGDEIVLTEAEHHANIVPWQFAAKKSGAVIHVAPVDDNGELILEEYERLLGPRTRIVSITHISNALGTVMPIREMTQMAKRVGATVVIDGAQGIPHRRVDVQAIGCDFYVFSGHKLFGPCGIGAVYAAAAGADMRISVNLLVGCNHPDRFALKHRVIAGLFLHHRLARREAAHHLPHQLARFTCLPPQIRAADHDGNQEDNQQHRREHQHKTGQRNRRDDRPRFSQQAGRPARVIGNRFHLHGGTSLSHCCRGRGQSRDIAAST